MTVLRVDMFPDVLDHRPALPSAIQAIQEVAFHFFSFQHNSLSDLVTNTEAAVPEQVSFTSCSSVH